jgi:hypothetical protein
VQISSLPYSRGQPFDGGKSTLPATRSTRRTWKEAMAARSATDAIVQVQLLGVVHVLVSSGAT